MTAPLAAIPRRRRRASLKVSLLYTFAILREFRATLALLAAAILLAAALFFLTPHDALAGRRPTLIQSLYAGWMALLAQPLFNPPQNWYLALLCAIYPLVGAILIGEGIVRLAMLMLSRRRGEKEWVRVMVSTYRDHVIVCGVGRLGYRILEHLLPSGIPIVAVELRKSARFVPKARERGIPVMIRDMKEDQALIDAGIAHARAIIIATNDSMANLEVALDARRMNPRIRVLMRMFDQAIAEKVAGGMSLDLVFSASNLAAPIVAARALEHTAPGLRIIAPSEIAGIPHAIVELRIDPRGPLAGKTVAAAETALSLRILGLTSSGKTASPPSPNDPLLPGDTATVHLPASRLSELSSHEPRP